MIFYEKKYRSNNYVTIFFLVDSKKIKLLKLYFVSRSFIQFLAFTKASIHGVTWSEFIRSMG